MSLATRCPACGTVFRVVQDQLKVSEGWVRCGRCSEVFNAIDSLFDLEQETPPPWPLAGSAGGGAVAGAGNGESAMSGALAQPPSPLPGRPPSQPQMPLRSPPAQRVQPGLATPDPAASLRRTVPAPPPPLGGTAVADASAVADVPPGGRDSGVGAGIRRAADVESNAQRADPGPTRPAEVSPLATAAPDVVAPATPVAADRREPTFDGLSPGVDGVARAAKPRFLVDAERAQRWQSPGVRAGLALLAVLLAVLATLQAALAWRDSLAARWPVLRPGLDALCVVAACRVEPWRRLAGLSVDGSGLARIDAGTTYRLTLLLRNRDTVPLHMPAFDLTLTDAQGSVVARRVLLAAEFGVTRPDIPAASELPLQAVIDPGNRRVVGYTVDIFYP